MGGSSKQTQTTEATKNPWAPAQPVLNDVLSKASQFGGDSSIWTPTYSNTTQAGIGQLAQAGQSPSFGAGAIQHAVGQAGQGGAIGQGVLQNTAQGGYLNGSPQLDAALRWGGNEAADMLASRLSGAGRFGANAATAKAFADQIGGQMMGAQAQNYAQERGLQNQDAGMLNQTGMAATAMAPQVDALEAQKAALTLQAGQTQDQMDQARRMAPINGVNWQAGLGSQIGQLGGTQNSTGTTTTTPSLGQQIIGGGMMGLGLLTSSPTAMGALSNGFNSMAYGNNGLPWAANPNARWG